MSKRSGDARYVLRQGRRQPDPVMAVHPPHCPPYALQSSLRSRQIHSSTSITTTHKLFFIWILTLKRTEGLR